VREIMNVTQHFHLPYLCYAYVVNPVNRTPIVYSRLRHLRSVRHSSLVAYPWPMRHVVALQLKGLRRRKIN
jgi:hypothetical protein